MFKKSDKRIALEEIIQSAHKKSQIEALRWCVKHPINGFFALISMVKKGEVDEYVAIQWRDLPSWKKYLSAYSQLEKLETQEGFPAMKYLSEQLEKIKLNLPEKCQKKAYYPFAGTDFYWTKIFDEIIFEDISYNQDFVKNMWWGSCSYQEEKINKIFSTLHKAEILSDNYKQKIQIINGDANITRQDNDFNKDDYTLIIKGGHSVTDFLETRYFNEELNFCSIIIINPSEDNNELNEEMKKRNYTCIFSEQDKLFYAPFSMGMTRRYIFTKK